MAYKDPDYDPIAAHKYYMEHRKLKGKRSTKGFSNTQKEQWMYVRGQLATQHATNTQAISAAHKATMQRIAELSKKANSTITEQSKAKIEAISRARAAQKEMLTNMAKAKIEDLRKRFKIARASMTPAQIKGFQEDLGAAIDKIRTNLQSKKEAITERGNTQKEQVRTETKQKREATKQAVATARADTKKSTDAAKLKEKAEYEKKMDEAYKKIRG